jgi:hypothetical protein
MPMSGLVAAIVMFPPLRDVLVDYLSRPKVPRSVWVANTEKTNGWRDLAQAGVALVPENDLAIRKAAR